MANLILHHFDPSPFAEKIRLVMGIKGLSWSSVQIPMIMPKPDLMPLTGGYRKTPVLQVGADIYCDTMLVANELEKRHPDPSLFPGGRSGLASAFGRWSDKAFFEPGAGLSMGENDMIPEPVLSDRKAFFNFMDFDNMKAAMPHCYAQFQAQCQLLEDELEQISTPFLGGDSASWLDILAYFPVWMVQGNVPRAEEVMAPFEKTREFAERMAAIGHGTREELDAKDALAVAKDAEPAPYSAIEESPFHNFSAGDHITVTPDDYGDVPVAGILRAMDRRRITIERDVDELGLVAVHFPRSGFRVDAA